MLYCLWGGIYEWVVIIKGALFFSAYGIVTLDYEHVYTNMEMLVYTLDLHCCGLSTEIPFHGCRKVAHHLMSDRASLLSRCLALTSVRRRMSLARKDLPSRTTLQAKFRWPIKDSICCPCAVPMGHPLLHQGLQSCQFLLR